MTIKEWESLTTKEKLIIRVKNYKALKSPGSFRLRKMCMKSIIKLANELKNNRNK